MAGGIVFFLICRCIVIVEGVALSRLYGSGDACLSDTWAVGCFCEKEKKERSGQEEARMMHAACCRRD